MSSIALLAVIFLFSFFDLFFFLSLDYCYFYFSNWTTTFRFPSVLCSKFQLWNLSDITTNQKRLEYTITFLLHTILFSKIFETYFSIHYSWRTRLHIATIYVYVKATNYIRISMT